MRYLRITGPDMNNGEGCRITLWLPGCAHKCKGCHNEWTHNYDQGADFTEDTYVELLEKLTPSYISGLTISGGDPLYQSNNVLADLYEWITRIRTDMPDKTIWLYTGFNFEDLRGIQMEIAQMCDVIVDGPYIEELRDVSLPFRGSSNQRIIRIQQQMTKEEAKSKYIISEQNKNDMKKSIFKGIINGQEFDNVNDYNARMNELMSTGQTIEASTSTQIVDVEEENCNETDCIDMLPGFSNPNSHYIDDNLNKDPQELGALFNDVYYPHISNAVQNMDEHAASNYLVNIKAILGTINHDQNISLGHIQQLENDIRTLNNGLGIIRVYRDLYEALEEKVNSKLEDLKNKEVKTPSTTTKTDKDSDQIKKYTLEEPRAAINKLAKEIFGSDFSLF